jgi:hypothetical protein
VDAADAAELIPRVEVLPVLVEDLDATVAAVRDEEPAARIEGERVRASELSRAVPVAAEALDELAVRRVLRDAPTASGVGSSMNCALCDSET